MKNKVHDYIYILMQAQINEYVFLATFPKLKITILVMPSTHHIYGTFCYQDKKKSSKNKNFDCNIFFKLLWDLDSVLPMVILEG